MEGIVLDLDRDHLNSLPGCQVLSPAELQFPGAQCEVTDAHPRLLTESE